jgi:hypothetical protein
MLNLHRRQGEQHNFIGRQRKNTPTHNRQAHLPLQTKEIIFSGGK